VVYGIVLSRLEVDGLVVYVIVLSRLEVDSLVVYVIVLCNHKTWNIWSCGARYCTRYATRLGADGLVVQGVVLSMPRDLE